MSKKQKASKEVIDNTVTLTVSRDEATFILNLLDTNLQGLLNKTNSQFWHQTVDTGEANLVYMDKAMSYRLCQVFNV